MFDRRRLLWATGSLLLAGAASGVGYVANRMVARRDPDPPDHPRHHGVPCEDVTFLARDGTLLRGWWMLTSSSHPTIVVAPGQGGSADGDVPAAVRLARHGFNVLLFDFRGHGRSAGEMVTFGYGEVLDLRGALDWLEQRGIHRAGVLGFSMGGAVAITTAALDARVGAVVADSPFARLHTVLASGMQSVGFPPLLATWVARLAILWVDVTRDVALEVAEPARWAHAVKAPLLIVQSGRDRFIPPSEARLLQELVPAPCELWCVPEADHREAERLRPDEYWARVTGWFRQFLCSNEQNISRGGKSNGP